MSRKGLAAFILCDGVLVGGEGYADGDRVVVVHWRGSFDALVIDAGEILLAQDDLPPISGVREKL